MFGQMLASGFMGFLIVALLRKWAMDEFFFSLPIDSKRSLCIGPITRREAANLSDSSLGDGTGLYLFVAENSPDGEVNIIARIGSYDTAAMFVRMLRSGQLPALAA